MDVKKSYKADLDSRRASGFLLGLVVVLSLFLVALEFTSRSVEPELGDDILDDVSQDIEMTPVVRRDDVVAAVSAKASHADAERLKVVDHVTNDATTVAPSVNNDILGGVMSSVVGGVTDIPDVALSPDNIVTPDNPLNFQVVERLPEFPGGMSKFVQWLTANLKYPVSAQRGKKEGTVLVSFIINKDGSVTDHKIVKSAAPELDREALRVIRMMPKWKPGEDHGKPCRTYFCIPVVFKL